MAVVELKDDSQASRLPLVEDGVIGIWLSGGEGNDQANSDKRHSDSQRSMAHKTSYKLSRPASANKCINLEIRHVLVRFRQCLGRTLIDNWHVSKLPITVLNSQHD